MRNERIIKEMPISKSYNVFYTCIERDDHQRQDMSHSRGKNKKYHSDIIQQAIKPVYNKESQSMFMADEEDSISHYSIDGYHGDINDETMSIGKLSTR